MKRPDGCTAMAIACALAIAGCGSSDGKVATESVRAFLSALERGDGAAACERLSEAGTAELLWAAVQAGVRADRPDVPAGPRCGLVATALAQQTSGLGALREARATGVTVVGDRAVVRTARGAYEAEEVRGRWLVSGFEPVARVARGAPAGEQPVHLVVIRPELREPALGPERAGRVRDETVELSGTLDPPEARLRAELSAGARLRRIEAGDGRFRVEVRLARGPNEVLLRAESAGRPPGELILRLVRE